MLVLPKEKGVLGAQKHNTTRQRLLNLEIQKFIEITTNCYVITIKIKSKYSYLIYKNEFLSVCLLLYTNLQFTSDDR